MAGKVRMYFPGHPAVWLYDGGHAKTNWKNRENEE